MLNASPSSQGRYPNAGPLMLARAGIRLIDAPGAPASSSGSKTATGCGSTAAPVFVGERGDRCAAASSASPSSSAQMQEHRDADRRGAGRIRREHRRPRARRDRPADRQHRLPADPRQLPRPPRPDRRPRRPPPPRPESAARLHPRHAAADRRRRRRRRRRARSRAEAGRDPRRHGLGQRRGAALRRRADRPRLPGRPGARAASACWRPASTTRSSPPPAPARTWRC